MRTLWAFALICEHVMGSPKYFSGNVPASVDKSCDLPGNELMEILMAQVEGLIPRLPPSSPLRSFSSHSSPPLLSSTPPTTWPRFAGVQVGGLALSGSAI